MLLVGTDAALYVVDGEPRPVLEQPVTALARSDGEWWALADRRAVLRSADGLAWASVASADDLALRCLSALPGGLLVGSSEAHVLRLDGDRLERLPSFDAIGTRHEWYTPWGDPPDTRSLAAGPEGTVLVNVHVGGVWRSGDGETWDPVVDVDADVHEVLSTPDSEVALAAAAIGFGQSHDAGRTWEWTTEGLHASYCRAVARAGDVTLVSASTGPRTGRGAVYRRLPGAKTFERCTTGLPAWFGGNVDTFCLAGEGDRAAIGAPDGTVYVSHDAGATWAAVATGLPAVRSVTLSA